MSRYIEYVAVSDSAQGELAALPYRGETEPSGIRTAIVEPGTSFIEGADFHPQVQKLLDRIDWNDYDRIVVIPGRIAERKNQRDAIRAALNTDPRTLVIVFGSPKFEVRYDGKALLKDPYHNEIRSLVREAGVSKRFIFTHDVLADVSDEDFERVSREMNLLSDAICTLAQNEGYGIAAITAAGHRTPTLASDIKAFRKNLEGAAAFCELPASKLEDPLKASAMLVTQIEVYPQTRIRRKLRLGTWSNNFSSIVPTHLACDFLDLM